MTEKYCKKCDQWKLFSEFSKEKRSKDGYRSQCKACRNEYSAEYYQKNSHSILENRRVYYADNRDRILEYQREYHQANQEKLFEYQQEWYQNNRDRRAEYNREYRQENREHILEYNQKWREANPDHDAEYYAENRDRILEYIRGWKKENPEKVRANNAKRRAVKKSTSTTDLWELNQIDLFYSDCPDGHHVDHIIPLNLGGRHEMSNLQHLEAWMNLSKGDKYLDDWDDPRPISCRAY